MAQAQAQPQAPALTFSGFLQVDWTAFRQSSQNEIDWGTGSPLNEDRFTLRRAHVRADYERGYLIGSLEVDANTVSGPQVRPIDAEVGARWPTTKRDDDLALLATIGLMRIPFGFEVQELDYVRPFLERGAVARALFPGEFDLGARIKGNYRFVNWAVALMNGDPIGERAFPGRDPNKTKDMVGRVGVDTKSGGGVRFEAGVSWLTGSGFHAGTPPTKDQLVWHDLNQNGVVDPTEIEVIPGSPATPSQSFHRWAIGGDARFHANVPMLGELTLRAEIVWAQNLDRGLVVADPVGAGHDVREFGWYVGATQEITSWAMIGARYDRYNPDADATSQVTGALVPKDATYSTLALMAMFRYETGRLVVEYDHNTNAVGRDVNGLPTNLKDDALMVRGQVTF